MPNYIVTVGLTRRLVEAPNQQAARESFRLGYSPIGGRLKVAEQEIQVREATEQDLYDFYPRRGAHQLRKANGQLFDVDVVAPKVEKRNRGEQS